MSSARIDPSWLTSAQAAARLGVKPATLYAYVSRGLIPRRRGPDGRTSYFAPADVERLARRTPHSRLAPTDIVVPTAVSLIDGANGALWYRGIDAIEAASNHSFEAVAELLWTGRWNTGVVWEADPACVRAAQRAIRALPRSAPPNDRIPVIVSAARAADTRSTDDLVRSGRNLLVTIIESLPLLRPEPGPGIAARLWARLSSAEPTRDQLKHFDTLLGLAAEHGVTLSVVAARLAASIGADPYAAIGSALGVAEASIEASRFGELRTFLAACERTGDPEAAAAFLPLPVPGISAAPYGNGDPRARQILQSLSSPVVKAAAAALKRRGKAEPDMSFATAAASFSFGFAPGSDEFLTAFARIAGWLAHAIDEYRRPTPFRPHATYTGTLPTPEQRDERRLLHAVMDYMGDE